VAGSTADAASVDGLSVDLPLPDFAAVDCAPPGVVVVSVDAVPDLAASAGAVAVVSVGGPAEGSVEGSGGDARGDPWGDPWLELAVSGPGVLSDGADLSFAAREGGGGAGSGAGSNAFARSAGVLLSTSAAKLFDCHGSGRAGLDAAW